MAKANLTAERARELLDYNPETGLILRRTGPRAGMPAGNQRRIGYIMVVVDRQWIFAHRLAWLIVHGQWPQHEIDHINGTRYDNRIDNLRDVPRAVNVANRANGARSDSTTGLLGVQVNGRHKKNPYMATIQRNGVRRYLGRFATPQAAHAAYLAAKEMP